MSARILLLLLVTRCAMAQQEPVDPIQPTLRITFTLIQVDAVVTDAHGRRVTDLHADDFEIKQDGVTQKVTHFSYVPDDRPPFVLQPKSKGQNVAISMQVPLAANQVKRTVALVVDDMGMSFESIVRVRDSLRKYVEQYMQPGDLMAIIRTGGGIATLEQFTNDKKILLAGVDFMKWRFGGRTGLITINPVSSEPTPKRDGPEMLDYGNQGLSALGALGTLDQVISGMRRLPGRKSVVFFSETMRMESRVNSSLDHLTDMANRAAVSLYAIDPTGLKVNGRLAVPQFPERGDEAAAGGQGGSLAETIFTGAGAREIRSNEGLDYLTKRTGGLFFTGRNDIPASIQQAVDDQMGYYLLGYSPQEGTFEKDSKKAKYHKVTVRVKRPGLLVRWKSGFNGMTDADVPMEEPTKVKTREEQLMEALASPFSATDLKVRLTCWYNDFGNDGPAVRSMLHFGAQDLTFHKQPDNSWQAQVDVVTSAYRGLKQTIQQRQRRENIVLSDDVYRKALKEGFLFTWDYPVKDPGAFLLRAVVRDAETARIGSASQSVAVPDTRKGQLALSGIVVNLSTGQAQPGGTSEKGDNKVEAWAQGGPAIRRYLPGQNILYTFVVVNPQRNSGKQSKVTKELRVYYNGKLLFSSPATEVNESGGRLDRRRLLGGGILRLGPIAKPGEYILQVIVTDKLARKNKSKVTQWIDFEVLKPEPQIKIAGR